MVYCYDEVKTAFAAACAQAEIYRTGLRANEDDRLKLRTFAIAAIGFERLL